MTCRTSSTERCETCAVPTTKYLVPPCSSVVTEFGRSDTQAVYHVLFPKHGHRDSRSDADRDRSRGLPSPRQALPGAHRRPEPRRHEPRGILPELPFETVP